MRQRGGGGGSNEYTTELEDKILVKTSNERPNIGSIAQ